MRSLLSFLVVLLACASLSFSDSQAGRPTGGSGGGGKGQILLTPENVSPGPGEAGAAASTSISYGRNEISFYMTIQQLSGFVTSIGIYRGQAGQIGPMVVRLCPSPISINQLNGTIPVSDSALLRDISRNGSNYFIQINTNLYPGGAVRAQLK
jgi:hypothetical protein